MVKTNFFLFFFYIQLGYNRLKFINQVTKFSYYTLLSGSIELSFPGFQGYVLFTPEQASTSASNSGYLNQENILIRVHITNSRTQGLPIKEAFSWRIYNQHSIDSNGACALFLNSDDLLHDLTINFGPIITGKQQEFTNEEFTGSIYQALPLGKQAKQNLNSLLGICDLVNF